MRDRIWTFAFVAAFVLLEGLLLASALTRPRLVSNDSFGYLDTARNIARGAGITQNAVGFNDARLPLEVRGPEPVTTQPPLFPLLIAGLVRAGVEPMRAALIVPLVALAALWVLASGLARAAWGDAAGRFAAGLLVLPVMFPGFTQRAWSELPALAFLFASFVLDGNAEDAERPRDRGWWSCASGLASGAAFATRYAFVVGAPIGVLRRLTGPRRDLRAALAFASGWLLIAAPVLVRNVMLTGNAAGGEHASHPSALGAVLAESVRALVHHPGGVALAVTAALGGAALVAGLARRTGSWRAVWAVWPGAAMTWPAAWAALYAVTLLVLRTRVGFDAIGLRLLAPVFALLLVFLAGLLARSLAASRTMSAAVTTALVLAVAAVVGAAIAQTPRVSPAELVAGRERLRWIRDHAAPEDLLVSENGVDLPYFFRAPDGTPRLVVAFSSPPYMQAITEVDLVELARRYRETHALSRNVWLIVNRREEDQTAPKPPDGRLLASLARGHGAPPRIVLNAALADAFVYRIDAPGWAR